jgi:hypothetical protein
VVIKKKEKMAEVKDNLMSEEDFIIRMISFASQKNLTNEQVGELFNEKIAEKILLYRIRTKKIFHPFIVSK